MKAGRGGGGGVEIRDRKSLCDVQGIERTPEGMGGDTIVKERGGERYKKGTRDMDRQHA